MNTAHKIVVNNNIVVQKQTDHKAFLSWLSGDDDAI